MDHEALRFNHSCTMGRYWQPALVPSIEYVTLQIKTVVLSAVDALVR
ncbi:MAG: hypothetical protein NTZ11_11615 [Gammaproteobacteria bacterium]|nr:hypothetical protein [Gammaproteobacteria bacterium]